MKSKDAFIQEILKDIYNLPTSRLPEERREQISKLIHTVINGDTITKYLVISVTIDNKRGIYLYILTNNRFIVFPIGVSSNEINTYPFAISEIKKVFFKSPELNKISVEISLFNNQLLGLEYSVDREDITSFFQELDTSVKNKVV
jgi:hypothetical protein